MRLTPLEEEEEAREPAQFLAPMSRHSERHPDLRLAASRSVGSQCLLFISQFVTVCRSLLQQPALTRTGSEPAPLPASSDPVSSLLAS